MDRHYGMDWLRIGAFALLIFYHIGMFFVPWGWHVKTAHPLEWVTVPMLASNAWRLPLLFLVSGYASAAMLEKGNGLGKGGGLGRFLGSRSARLLIPLVFAAIVIIPVQPWIELQFKHGYTAGFWHFWAHNYFRFGKLDGIVMPTWQHLWFVVYLWVYTLALVLLLAVTPRRLREWLTRIADRVFAGPGVLLVPIALFLVHLGLSWPGQEETHALVDDGMAHRIYFSVFLFGVFLRNAPLTWEAVRRWWKAAAIAALAGFAVVAAVDLSLLDPILPGAAPQHVLFEVARIFQGWGTIVALIGIADRWWNRDHPLRAMLTEAVFPFYIIHQTIIVVTGWYLLPLALPALAEFAILLPATVIGCWLFYWIGRRIVPLRPLIGLRLASPQRSAKAAAQPPGVP
ncbi:acyltransferase family protein [Sphingomonas sp. LB-2]|uniref:acyltransferase family protein n=1 Tax=Sphingomonas caeni TaxID=2984949 RepID=UPI0022308949|nr:acyltransferase family protein [Sphingomonas caeni]MCW3846221.1 acyltransferase family protein [Sphingomonas caeni]